jgi:hypothetical protein
MKSISGNSIVGCRRNTAVSLIFSASDQRQVLGNCSIVAESGDRRGLERNSGLGFVLEDRSPHEDDCGRACWFKGVEAKVPVVA